MNNTGMDFLYSRDGQNFEATGSVAARLLASGFNPNSLRTNAVLRKDEWIQYDSVVVEVARQRLVGVGDLLNAGLRYDVANALGTTRVEWEQVSDMTPAEISMAGVTDGERDRATFNLKAVPLPVIHKEFSLNIRALEASRRLGQTLDTTQAALSTRLVTERIEAMLFDGVALTSGSETILGYRTAPNRNTGSISDWANVATTGTTMLNEVLAMISALVAKNMYGPYGLYIPLDYWVRLQDDFKTNSDRSILERILAIEGLNFIRPSNNLPGAAAGQVIMVQMTSDVVDMVMGMEPGLVEWDEKGGMVMNFKVMAIMVPRMKDDAEAQSGIAHYSV